ncbi:chitinase [Francisella sp. Scap27]|uniref:glycosyl hydrolase family 18 protein n=1 Tax=Francisella sp. Scap27 TaxID=2589986 RepID=UPI0015B8C0C2|nr:glycosyl hydrolase family 18 protein [Francisella sp. Scap27]QLE79324.1 chitinase [Francisella sp. Scap27]
MKYFNKLLLVLFILTSTSLIAEEVKKVDEIKTEKTNSMPDRILGGFLDIRTPGSATRVNIEKVKKDGYNLIIAGFGEVYGTDIGFNLSGNNSNLSMQTAIGKIRQAKSLGLKVFLGVGGSPNTFHPGVKINDPDPKILGKSITTKQINTLAANIVKFLKKYNLDGIEFSIRRYTSASFINDLTGKIKEIDPNLIIAAEPEINDYKLVTTGRSNDYDMAIQSGNISYLFLQEYNIYPQYDPNYIAESYSKIIKNSKIPLETRILIEEPTNATAGGINTIYHPGGDGSKSLSTEAAVSLMLPQLELLKHKPRFTGIVGWSLNTDYASDLYGDKKHKAGAFAESLEDCIYNNICTPKSQNLIGPVIAGYLSLWGRNSSYNVSGQQINSTPIDIKMPKDQEYCDKYPDVCKYNTIIAAYLTYTNSSGFRLTFDGENGNSKKEYTPEEVKEFTKYMGSKGKHVVISVGGKFSHINWKTIDLDSIEKVIQEYGFDGINFDLGYSDIPKTDELVNIATKKIKKVVANISKNRKDTDKFWLTFSPNWQYVIASINKDLKENTFENHKYVELLNQIGMNSIDYIFLKTYSEEVKEGILGPYKNQNKEYQKITPRDQYSKFLTSLVWAITTQEGYDANLTKYKQTALIISPKKLVLLIPATEGATAKGKVYMLNPEDIDNVVKDAEKYNASFGGFALWNMDFDATNIKEGDLTENYSHQPWSMTKIIASIILPEVKGQVTSMPKPKKVVTENSYERTIDTGIINYPYKLGTYTANTIIEFQGKKYKCLSADLIDLCNNNSYIPNGLHGYLAWQELNKNNTAKKVEYKKIILDDETPTYPEGIGDYKPNRVVKAGDNRTFECIDGKETLCNNIIYSPTGDKGYQAWSDITSDISHLEETNTGQNQYKPQGAEYIYPNGHENYVGGTTVAIGNVVYRCKIGPESSLCPLEAYSPDGKYSSDAWSKV